jgi:transcriptional regulator with XRE-family HTH domain
MSSFRLNIKPNRRAAARFVGRVRSKLQEAVVADRERIGITQTKIADAIGVHRSVISRELNGRQDITLGRVAELAWAMGREIVFDVRVPEVEVGQNAQVREAGALTMRTRNGVSLSNNATELNPPAFMPQIAKAKVTM